MIPSNKKVTVITVVRNRHETISDALASFQCQDYPNKEHVVIDGASTDGTLELLRSKDARVDKLVSEPDKGIYDALNKGMAIASGDIVGVLHADDLFAHNRVLSSIASTFMDESIHAVYGDLVYVRKRNAEEVVRHWKAGGWSKWHLRFGWMPPHPTVFIRRDLIQKLGDYDTSYRVAADYDYLLKMFMGEEFRARYMPEVLVKMRLGGASNGSVRGIVTKMLEDYRALRSNKVGGLISLMGKNLQKIPQFWG